jgi:hypothetical protein
VSNSPALLAILNRCMKPAAIPSSIHMMVNHGRVLKILSKCTGNEMYSDCTRSTKIPYIFISLFFSVGLPPIIHQNIFT